MKRAAAKRLADAACAARGVGKFAAFSSTAFHADFTEVIDRRSYPVGSIKWRKYDEGVIPMWVADMDFRAPCSVRSAISQFASNGVYGYSRVPSELTEGALRYLETNHDVRNVQASDLVFFPSMMEAIKCAIASVGESDDCASDVMVCPPVYYPFFTAMNFARKKLNAVPMRHDPSDNGWYFDWDEMERKATPRTDVMLLCSPQNPTGKCFERHELERLLDFCDARGITLLSDEIHCDLVLSKDHRFHSIASFPGRTNCATFFAPSKTYNVAGTPAAFAVVPDPSFRRALKATANEILPPITCFGLVAAMACYGAGDHEAPTEWREALLARLRENASEVRRRVNTAPFRDNGIFVASRFEATYLAWLDARAFFNATGEHASQYFERVARVGLSDGTPFGAEGYCRLNFACPPETLREALDRMEASLPA